ncbi:hypothetical protein GH714_002871 [Hevea brasiliensis]|uniref:Uncharacterized protein n=1 Tax=Hevea brasiliensis TaxID=3981 RepID=A0A6A6LCP3_HEVBR|nr:hypothetical protein GH714_002871 [Hevea brasiliensis]
MTSTFDANENVAMKALAEANELHMQKSQLEEMLQKANEDLQSARDDYETKLHDLSCQLNLKMDQIEHMLVEIDDKRKQLEIQKARGRTYWIFLSGNREAKKERKLRKQVFQLKGDLKKKDDAITSIEKKLKESSKLTAVSDNTKTALRNNKSAPVPHGSKEAANLWEKIRLLEGQIKLKEAALETSANSFLKKEMDLLNKIEELEHRVEELNQNSAIFFDSQHQELPEDNNGVTSNGDLSKDIRSTDDNLSSTAWISGDNGNAKSLVKSNCAIISGEELKTSVISNGDCNTNELISELESLKERNKSMENELKEMQERYSEMSLKFAEVEGERQQLVMTVRSLKNAKKS